MKVSLNWVKDYVKLPDDMDLKRLSYDLTMSTVEVEDATDLSESFHNMVIGVVQQVQQHPNADKLFHYLSFTLSVIYKTVCTITCSPIDYSIIDIK